MKERKIAKVVNRIPLEMEGETDLDFWLTQTPDQKFEELMRLRKFYWEWKLGFYPTKIEKVVNKISMNDSR